MSPSPFISGLRSVDFSVPDVAAATRFYTECWGLTVAARQGDTVYLAASGDDHHVLALHPGGAPEIRSITFRAHDQAALAALAARVPDHGARILRPVGPIAEPGGGVGFSLLDPRGRVMRFVADDQRKQGAAQRDYPLRLAHVNINATDVEECRAFFEAGLGFALSDRSKLMAFERCNADHHIIVIAESKTNNLNHVAFLVPDLESVMRASGRMVDHGFPIGWGVGRHGPGDNVFAYFLDPDGFVIEHTAEVLQVDEHYRVRGPDEWVWPPGRTDQWGIAPPKSAAVKHAQEAIPFATSFTGGGF